MRRTLLLNNDWSPLNFVSDVRALSLLNRGRAEIISSSEGLSVWDEKIVSPSREFIVPATLRLLSRVHRRWTAPRFRKNVLFNRDNWQCQYCGTSLDWHTITIDHVTPRCRGGATSWKNCVASCKRCNAKKGARTLQETGMKLSKKPAEPKVTHYWEVRGATQWHPDWDVFIT
jgi:5-methylcytosine-specific restriction endonuclease McrA